MVTTDNVDWQEVDKFGAMAERWWDTQGEFKTLHDINPLRLAFIADRVGGLAGKRVVDVGCGGGILAEAMAQQGAEVLGIDLSAELVEVADLHSLESGVPVRYQVISAEALAEQAPAGFEVVTCMEMLEHVPDPAAIIGACARLLRPGGQAFFSTLNRNPLAYLLAIVAAEHVLRMLPKGTHDYRAFIKPSELGQSARQAGLQLQAMAGIGYNPLSKRFYLGKDISVNYLAAFSKPE